MTSGPAFVAGGSRQRRSAQPATSFRSARLAQEVAMSRRHEICVERLPVPIVDEPTTCFPPMEELPFGIPVANRDREGGTD